MIGERKFGRQLNGRKYANVSQCDGKQKVRRKAAKFEAFELNAKVFFSSQKSICHHFSACTVESTGRPF